MIACNVHELTGHGMHWRSGVECKGSSLVLNIMNLSQPNLVPQADGIPCRTRFIKSQEYYSDKKTFEKIFIPFLWSPPYQTMEIAPHLHSCSHCCKVAIAYLFICFYKEYLSTTAIWPSIWFTLLLVGEDRTVNTMSTMSWTGTIQILPFCGQHLL